MEELFVKGKFIEARSKITNLYFIPHYFIHMDIGFLPTIYRFSDVLSWFALGCPYDRPEMPHPGRPGYFQVNRP